MSSSHKVLVTGATGVLGTAVCHALVDAGLDIRATDRKFAQEFPCKIVLGDLLDERFVYQVIEDCTSVVHLGNHPNMFVGPSAQQILAENVRMNANVFWAAAQLGLQHIVFASSVQVMLNANGGKRQPPYTFPYFPLDGKAPRDPGTNAYAMSKEVGERNLEVLCGEFPELCATALRFPMLPRAEWVAHLRQTRMPSPARTNLGECSTHLTLEDAAALVVKVLERPKPGYRQYFPAWTIQFRGLGVKELYQKYYAHVPLRCALEELTDFVDLGELRRDFDWQPSDRIVVQLDEHPLEAP